MRGYAYQRRELSPEVCLMIRKILKYVGIAIACLLVLVPSSALSYRKYLQHKVADEWAITSPTGINSLESVRIGGIDQWIEVRGQNVNNPILLVIHGGPGVAFIPLARSFQGPWENRFTVVEWDQRGAGKTYASKDKDLQRRTMNVPQMEQDTLDVANYLRNRFQRKKIFVMGHSWGSLLSLWLAHEHPDLIYAYVGVGQVVNPKQNDEVAYRNALQEARSTHNQQAVRELESNAPSPNVDLRKGQTPLLLREREERLRRRARNHGTAREVVRVLEGEDGRAGQVVDGFGPDPGRHLLFRHPAARRVDGAWQEARQRGHASHLVMEDVALSLEDDFRAGTGVDAQRELVTHRAGRDEEGRLLAEYLGRLLLEAADGRVLSVDVVANLRLGHGAPHFRSGLRDGVGAEVGSASGHARIIPERARRGRGRSRGNRFCSRAHERRPFGNARAPGDFHRRWKSARSRICAARQ